MTTSRTNIIFNICKDEADAQFFSAGQTIFERDQIGEQMYVVLEGEVDILFQDRVINTHQVGEIFGEMALIDTKIRSATAIAKTDCKLVPVSERRFIYLIQEHPYFALSVMQILAERLRRRTES